MLITENIIMYLTYTHHSNDRMEMKNNPSYQLLIMFIAMGIGFISALPYNYYLLTKTGKICHNQ